MKTVAVGYFIQIIEDIMQDKEELAKLRREEFIGVPASEVLVEVENRLGNNWWLKKISPRITKEDFKVMATGRFYKSGGIKYLGVWMILILALLQCGSWFPFVQPYNYILCGLVTIGFALLYEKKLKIAYREFMRDIWEEKTTKATKIEINEAK